MVAEKTTFSTGKIDSKMYNAKILEIILILLVTDGSVVKVLL